MNKKVLFLALILCLAFAGSAQAQQVQFRLDPLVSVPFMLGAKDATSGTDLSFFVDYVIPFPELGVYAQFDFDMIKFGVGIRAFTLILVSLITPDVYVEFHLDPIVLRASVAGGFGAIFGMIPFTTFSGPIIVPDINVSFKLGEIFRVGAGIAFIADFNNLDTFLYAPYVQARFVITMGGEKKSEE
jgi:hypothetical protein